MKKSEILLLKFKHNSGLSYNFNDCQEYAVYKYFIFILVKKIKINLISKSLPYELHKIKIKINVLY